MAPLETIGPFQNATEGRNKMITEEAMTLSFRGFVFHFLPEETLPLFFTGSLFLFVLSPPNIIL